MRNTFSCVGDVGICTVLPFTTENECICRPSPFISADLELIFRIEEHCASTDIGKDKAAIAHQDQPPHILAACTPQVSRVRSWLRKPLPICVAVLHDNESLCSNRNTVEKSADNLERFTASSGNSSTSVNNRQYDTFRFCAL